MRCVQRRACPRPLNLNLPPPTPLINYLMLKQVGVALEGAVNLSPYQKKDVYDAVDWYNTDDLSAIGRPRASGVEIVIPDEGKWYGKEMSK